MASSQRSSFESTLPDTPSLRTFSSSASSSASSLASIVTPDTAPVLLQPDVLGANPLQHAAPPSSKEDLPLFANPRYSLLRSSSIQGRKRDSVAFNQATVTSPKLRSRLSMSSLMTWKRKRTEPAAPIAEPVDEKESPPSSVSSTSTLSVRNSDDSARTRSNSTASLTSLSTQSDPTSCIPGTYVPAPVVCRPDETLATFQKHVLLLDTSTGFSDMFQHSYKRSTDLLTMLARNNPSFCPSTRTSPPRKVLDLGCGDAAWIYQAAKRWTTTEFVGMDIAERWQATERLRERNELPLMQQRVQFIRGHFLHDLGQFAAESFDHVRIAFLSLSLPKGTWKPFFNEVERILTPGGRVEFIDEAPLFPTDQPRLAADFGLTLRGDSSNKMLEDSFKTILVKNGLISSSGTDLGDRYFERPAASLPNYVGETTMLADFDVQLPPPSMETRSAEATLLVNWGADGQKLRHYTLRLSPLDLQLFASRNMNMLLSYREQMWKHLSESGMTKARFDDAFIEYESSQRRRLGLDTEYDPINEWVEDEVPLTPRKHIQPIEAEAANPHARTVRHLRVYEARKPV